MAAITYWVDPVSGDDANTGTSFGASLKTNNGVAAKINAAGNGNDYTVNLVNTGDHPWTGATTQIDNLTTSTFHIRGTDSSGNPALAKVVCDSTIVAVTQPFLYIREHADMLVEYVETDTKLAGGSHALVYSRDENDPDVQGEVRYCKFVSASLPNTNTRTFVPVYRGVSNYTDFNWHHCYFEGQANYINSFTDTFGDTKIHHNVIIDTGEHSLFGALCVSSFDATGVEIYNNTVFLKATSGVGLSPVANHIIAHSVPSGTVEGWVVKNNLFWKDVSPACAAVTTGDFIMGSAAGTAVYDGTEDIGYNLFYLGPNVEALGDSANVSNYNGLPFSPGVDDLYTGDVRRNGVTEAVAFNDTSSTYSWTPSGSSVAIEIAYDLRLLIDTDAGEGGSVPGALPAAVTDFTVTATSSRAYPYEEDSVTVTVTVSNSGQDATGVEVTVSVPTGLTVVTATPSAGTYSSGVWTVGSLNDAASATLELACTVDTSTAGTTLTTTATLTDSTPASGVDTGDDTDSVALEVQTRSIEDPDAPSAQPYLDVVPIKTTELLLHYNVALQTKRNRLRRHYVRSDIEGERWREASLRRIEIGTNTTTKLNLGGIERGVFLMLESSTQIDVSVGNQTNLYVPAKVVVLQRGDFEQVHLRNQSTTVSATVLYGVID